MTDDIKRSVTVGALAALSVLAVTGGAPSAQAQSAGAGVYYACYVPGAGLVYRIKEAGLPSTCRGKNHVEFSWTAGAEVVDHGALGGLADDDHPEYVREGEAAGGDLGGTYPSPVVMKLRGRPLADAAPANGQVLAFDGVLGAWKPASVSPAGGSSGDHGALSGLVDDDHPQYLLAQGTRASANGFAVSGTAGIGAIPAAGAGTRLMWYPGRAAFRAGHVGGLQWNDALIGAYSTAFGINTTASGDASLAIGFGTTADGHASAALGQSTVASNTASLATGYSTTATGFASTAMGSWASTNGTLGTFVYGDRSATGVILRAMAPNSFVVRAQRVWFGKAGDQVATAGRFIETSTGAYLTDGGTWTNASDVSLKENFRTEDPDRFLEELERLPITSWNYRKEDATVRHLGPTAQDFYGAFGLGDSDKSISTVDAAGVALLAIQALAQRTRELETRDERFAVLARETEGLRAELAALRAELGSLRAHPRARGEQGGSAGLEH